MAWVEQNGTVVVVLSAMIASGFFLGSLTSDLAAERELRRINVEALSGKLAAERELRTKDVEMLTSRLRSVQRELEQTRRSPPPQQPRRK